ncbi:2Fe-2S iron-sulfur cluster-binding protein [Halorussus halophilus]|uniref:2Fe-2S iron-sulfur cluster-binding protein n=1 Tax=Halorussus halophilus TaxID=2650975 RepID=UPI00130131ED|nr:2Fe-2S iron-sulfur cluster-binding protein [Halorussus halophilus]
MPTVRFRGTEIECEEGDVLRDVLLDADLSPHNGSAKYLNCKGHATCGTCAVEVHGDVSAMNDAERRRLSFPPHDVDSGLRLSCQTEVLGDVAVVKHPGFWGQHVERGESLAGRDDTSERVESGPNK